MGSTKSFLRRRPLPHRLVGVPTEPCRCGKPIAPGLPGDERALPPRPLGPTDAERGDGLPGDVSMKRPPDGRKHTTQVLS